jgi:glycosyltransferase involved in cell wall biosynthesis
MKISVIVTTYNHEKYIAECLQSILCQTGNFKLEVIVGDDCSTDNTRMIVQQFQATYPEIITILPPEANLGITKNLQRCLMACTGDYIAICEGDDYWTNTNKLQKQKDFLEEHENYSLCFNAISLFYEDENTFAPHGDQAALTKRTLTTEDLIKKNYIGNFSCCMYRTEIVRKLPPEIYDFYTVDWMFNLACSQLGKIGFIRKQMSVYRLHAKGAWTGMTGVEKLKQLDQYIDTYNHFFDYKYDALFQKYKDDIATEIQRLQVLENTESFDQSPEFHIIVWHKVKDVLRPIVRKVRQIKANLRSF